jgi:DNA polymerase elongation subunit (family B)
MKENLQIIHEIGKFLRGHNEKLKYVVNVETFTYHNYANCIIHEQGKVPYLHKEKFTPFLYLKNIKKYGINLYGGDKEVLNAAIEKFGIKIDILNTGNQPRLENGYMIKVSSTLSYNAIINFLKGGGLDMWLQDENKESKNKHLFNTLTLDEQFFISTGIRLFKGIEQYVGVHKLIFDIETTGLRAFNSRVFLIGVRDNRGFETILKVQKENDDFEEKVLIEKFFNIIDKIKPAIIAGYNSEEFDFHFIIERAKILGILSETKIGRVLKYYGNFKTTLSDQKDGEGRYTHTLTRKPNSSVKFGNSADRYTATQMWGYSITDIMHAVKRTVAVNTEIKSTKLKYIAKFEDIAKPDRMYIEGDRIFEYWRENSVFISNPINNKYERIPLQYQEDAKKLIVLQKQKVNLSDEEYANIRLQTLLEIRQEFIDWQRSKIEQYTNKFKLITGVELVERYLLDDLWETDKIDTLYNQSSFMLAKIVPTSYTRVSTMGNAAVWNLLMTTWSFEKGLAIPIPDQSESFSGGLARCYRKGLNRRIVKLDFASLYPMLQLTYGIFPQFDITGVIRMMLLYMSTTRNIYKNLANGKKLKSDQVELLKLIDEPIYNKYVSGVKFTDEEKNLFKVKQLPIKIINNSLFGALGSAIAFMWSDNVCASRITSSGRVHLRQMIKWFKDYGLIPLLAVTDGVNFSYPEKSNIRLDGTISDIELPIDEIWTYTVENETLTGIKALVEKFNNEVMPKPFMGVDMDGIWLSSLNLSRINYANLSAGFYDKKKNKDVPEKIKLTGNTIKSKVMPEYIEEFIDKGLNLILHDDGEGFVEYYNEYLQKIYYKQIPLKKIATKKKYKINVNQYRNRGTDKNGRLKAKMAHMEAVMQERDKLAIATYEKEIGKYKPEISIADVYDAIGDHLPNEPDMDSYIYYVNVGKKKGDADSGMIDAGNGEKMLASQIIKNSDLENNPDMVGEYNIHKYVDAFNKRVNAILEGFDPNIRKMILINNPAKREYFSKSELELKSFEADDFESSMVLEEKELEFWNRTGLKPSSIWDGYKLPTLDALDEIDDYETKVALMNLKMREKNDLRVVRTVNEKINNNDFVLHKNFNIYDLYHYVDNKLTLVRPNMFAPDQDKEYDFMEIGLSKKTIEMKREMVKKFKEEFKIDENTKLSSIPNALLRLEDFIRIEIAKEKTKKEEEEEVFEDENDD